jgi:hypothetical protein
MKRIAKVLLGFNAISLIHLFRLDLKQFLRTCSRAFTSARIVPNPTLLKIPVISLGEILGDRKPVIRLSVMQYEDGMLASEHAMALLAILVAEAPKEVLEIGTYMGHTTRQMAENLETATIHTVDLPESFSAEHDPERKLPKDDFHLINRRIVGREFKGRPCANRIVQHFADTASWDFQEAGRPTFYFIDGSHTYEYCKNNSEKCFALSEEHSVFLWHDCDGSHPGVVRFLSECRDQGMDVKRIGGTPVAYWKRV